MRYIFYFRYNEARRDTDHKARYHARDGEGREIVGKPCILHNKCGTDYLSRVVRDASRGTDAHRCEYTDAAEQYHKYKREHRSRETVYQADGTAEEERGKHHSQKRYRDRISLTETV